MGFEGAGDGNDLGQAAPHDAAVPLAEVARSAGGIRLAPKLDDLLFVYPGAGRFPIYLQQFDEAGRTPVRDRALQQRYRVFRRDCSPRAARRTDSSRLAWFTASLRCLAPWN